MACSGRLGKFDFLGLIAKLNSIVEANEVWGSKVLEIDAGNHPIVACIGRTIPNPNPDLIPHGK